MADKVPQEVSEALDVILDAIPRFPMSNLDWLRNPTITNMTNEERGIYMQLLAWLGASSTLPVDAGELSWFLQTSIETTQEWMDKYATTLLVIQNVKLKHNNPDGHRSDRIVGAVSMEMPEPVSRPIDWNVPSGEIDRRK